VTHAKPSLPARSSDAKQRSNGSGNTPAVASSTTRRPACFRFILTVDNPTAERFARLDGVATERAIRDAIQKTFRGAARDVQGVFAVHQHGGHDRPSHPHVHALLSPRLQNGAPIHFSPRAIETVDRKLAPLTPLRLRETRARQPLLPFDRGYRRRRMGQGRATFAIASL